LKAEIAAARGPRTHETGVDHTACRWLANLRVVKEPPGPESGVPMSRKQELPVP